MNKEDFLKKLRKKIDILEESEVEDIIDEYAGFIDEKVSQGFSEEEAVKSMGNINELARELLSAYKVKNPNTKNGDVINNFVDEFLSIIEKIIGIFANKSFKDIVRFIIELICIFIIIALCKIPFLIIRSMGSDIFISLSNSVGGVSIFRALGSLGSFVLEMCYLIFAVILFVKIFQSKYLNGEDDYISVVTNNEVKDKKNDTNTLEKNVVNKRDKNKITEHRGLGIIDGLTNICVIFIKIIAFCILMGVVFYIVGMSTAFGLSIYLLIRGVLYFGFYLVIFSLLILGILAFVILFNFIFDRKGKVLSLLITSLVCFGLLGVGISICAVEVANTTIIYDSENTENKKTDSYEYEMKDNLVLIGHYDEFIIDESLENKIKIEYSYNDDFMDLSLYPDTYKDGNYEVLHSYYNVRYMTYDKKIFDNIIENLKDKTIKTYDYDVTVKVYASSNVKEKLHLNIMNYRNTNHYDDYDLEDICEYIYDKDYVLPEYCLPFYSNNKM